MNKAFLLSILLFSSLSVPGADYRPKDYIWTTPSRNSSESMPCGGHDIGMNVWVENGDLLFYIAQSGWFDENNTLLKAGRWRLHLEGRPLDNKHFEQRLCLDEGAIYIKGSDVKIRIWADVQEPVVFVALSKQHAVQATLSYESWRYRNRPVTKAEGQQCSYKWILPNDCMTFADSIRAEDDRLTFTHRNRKETVFDFTVDRERMSSVKDQLYNPIGGLEMKGVMYAPGFHYAGTTMGEYAGTDYRAWNYSCPDLRSSCIVIDLRHLNHLRYEETVIDGCGTVAPYTFPTLKASDSHKRSATWWHEYWQRSWIQTDGTNAEAARMVRNYELMRYMLGCNAYGEWPTKFNGGLFTFDPVYVDSAMTFTPDYRKWGGGTMTAQNQRLIYWPMLKSGDYELLRSQLDTYLRMLPNAIAWSRRHWGHGGACFSEQIENFGLPNPAEYGKHRDGDDWGVEKNKWLEYEWDTALEFCQMAVLMRPRYPDATLDKYQELIDETLRFFVEHYPNLVIFPGSGCETYKMARNPASTIAALHALNPRPPSDSPEGESLKPPLGEVWWGSDIPLQVIDGDTCIAPAESWERIQNTETPQLYPVFPWRIYGLGRPHINIARNTYFKDPHALQVRSAKGWKQDNIWAACLGLTDEARRLTSEKFADGPYRFPAFWDPGFDWAPDLNRGGAAMIGLQEMLLQEDLDGNPILFPAWPREWNCHFRLFLSGRRCIEAEIKDGVVTSHFPDLSFSPFENAQWIGAITRQDARLPEGRNYTGSKLKDPWVREAWMNADTLSQRSILLRRDIRLKKTVRKATVYIVGLGFYELTINGRRVGDDMFAPLWSDYDKTIYYNTYDVTSLLSPSVLSPSGESEGGPASLQVLLGNGFFNEQGKRYAKMKISFGPPTLLFRMHIQYEDGTAEDVVSDSQWQWALSPITFNSIYGGEDYDARLEETCLSPSGESEGGLGVWHPVVLQEAPKGTLRRQIAQPVRIMERYSVKDTIRHDSILVLDMGQNLAGFPEITVMGKRGQWLKLTPGETLTEEGVVSQKQTGRPHYYTYILGGKTIWHPRFSYYGYRYLQIEGDIDVLKKVESCFVYNAAPKTGNFECSNPLFNDAYRLIDRAIRSNWQAVWTDCPHREKLGWLEQDWLNGEGLVANYDCRTMIEQTMQNIADAQYPNGALPEIAPNYVIFEGSWAPPFLESPEWGGAFIALPFLYQTFYGSDILVKRYRPQMKRYVDYLATQDSCYILRQGLGDWYDYGPKRAGFTQNTPVALVSTAHYYWWNHLMGEERADSIKTAFIREFYNPATHQYATGSQCAQAIALEMDLIPEGDREAVLQQLVNNIHAHGDRLTTGDIGNRYLFNALIHNGQQELLYQMLNHYDVPGYGYQIRLGHTTLTEQWNPEHGASMNHFMMAHLNNLLIPYFLGIWRDGEHITIAPHPVGDLTWCRGEMDGIKAYWHIEQDTFILQVDIPTDKKATIRLPYSQQTSIVSEGQHTLISHL